MAAVGAVRCYLALYDAPAAAAAAEAAAEASLAALSPDERKKEKLKRKKVGRVGGGQGARGGWLLVKLQQPPDPDPDGAKLASTSDPLGEATKFVVMLTQAAPQHLESQLAAAEVYGRKGRHLLEAAAVKRAREVAGPEHPDVHRAIVKFAQRGCMEAHKLLLSGPLADAAAAAEFKKSCAAIFKRSGYLGGEAAMTSEQLAEKLLALPIA
eukprot:gene4728-4978_t